MKWLTLALLLFPLNAMTHEPPTLQSLYNRAEAQFRLPKGILVAIGWVESRHNPKALTRRDGVSKMNSYGLLQLQVGSARQVGFRGKPSELLHPEANVKWGAAYLNYLLTIAKGDMSKALVGWNAGPHSTAFKRGQAGPYVGKVFNAYVRGVAK